jgi:hypothetical protein
MADENTALGGRRKSSNFSAPTSPPLTAKAMQPFTNKIAERQGVER